MEYDFSTLPVEMQREYMLYLPVTDIANYCTTNFTVKEICMDDYFWLLKVNHDFPGVSRYKPKDITYQQQFLDLLDNMHPIVATIGDRIDILEWLYSKGIRPTQETIAIAATYERINVLEWLYSKGIHPTQVNADIAMGYRQVNVLKWLADKGLFPSWEYI